jgi:hypothetical protein
MKEAGWVHSGERSLGAAVGRSGALVHSVAFL